MDHQEFVVAYKNGSLNFFIADTVAAEYLSRRLLLPLFILPVLGAGVALALIGWIFTGIIVFLVGVVAPRLIKRNAVPILLYQALHDADAYEDLRASGVLEIQE